MARIRATIKVTRDFINRPKAIVRDGYRPVGEDIKRMIRRGTGSVNAQFSSQRTITPSGSIPWKAKVTPWGDRREKFSSAGQSSGRWKRAWLGSGQGSFSRTTRNAVTVGVQKSKFPQVNILMSDTPTTWYPKKRIKGRWAAQIFHGMTYNVWISDARFAQGFVHNPRAISVNTGMENRIAQYMEQYAAWVIDPSRNRKPRAIL